MKATARLTALCVGLMLAAAPAHAGPCSMEIEALTQALAGTGADANLPATGAMPKAPSTAGTLPANPLETTVESPNLAGADAMPKAPSTAGALPANPLASTAEGPNVPDARVAPQSTAAATPEVAASLERAHQLDQAGDEAACMAEIAKVKELIGIR
jgi:hypothetical protein